MPDQPTTVETIPSTPQPSTTATPSPQPKATETPTAPKGIDGMMAEFDKLVTPKPPETKPETKSEPDKGKPAETKPPQKGESDKSKPEEVDWERVAPKVKGAHFKEKRILEDKISELDKKIKAIESKPKETVADSKLVEEYTKKIDAHAARIKDLEGELTTAAYERSAEFNKAYREPWFREKAAAINEVKQLTVSVTDANGETSKRQGTEADFEDILTMTPGKQDRAVTEMFGPSAQRVFTRIINLSRIAEQGRAAMQEHYKGLNDRLAEKELADRRSNEALKTARQRASEGLQRQWPEYFSADGKDEELAGALGAGYKFVEDYENIDPNKLSIDDRAAYNEVIKARCAATPMLVIMNKRQALEISSLKEELKKFRASDPGSGTETSGAPKPKEAKIGGIAGMTAKFNET